MKVLLAGSTGYLGSYILKELIARNIQTRIVVRNTQKLDPSVLENSPAEVLKAEITRPETLSNCCEEFDTVISTVGITRQKDGLTYMDVDYQANLNLLREAQNAGVRKFMSEQKFGPVKFFMTVMAMEMTAPEYGNHKLREYFSGLK